MNGPRDVDRPLLSPARPVFRQPSGRETGRSGLQVGTPSPVQERLTAGRPTFHSAVFALDPRCAERHNIRRESSQDSGNLRAARADGRAQLRYPDSGSGGAGTTNPGQRRNGCRRIAVCATSSRRTSGAARCVRQPERRKSRHSETDHACSGQPDGARQGHPAARDEIFAESERWRGLDCHGVSSW